VNRVILAAGIMLATLLAGPVAAEPTQSGTVILADPGDPYYSKHVAFSPLSLAATFLLAGCGAFLFLHARSWWARGIALLVATFSAWAPLVFIVVFLGLINVFFFRPELGADLYNYHLGLLALGAFVFELALVGATVFLLRRWVGRPAQS